MYDQLSDGDLLALIVLGNHDAFAEIVTRHTDRYFALAFHTLQTQGDAEDVVQTAFIKLWQKPQSWNSDKSRFTTWFYQVIVNACHDHRRKHKRLVDVDDLLLEAVSEPIASEQHLLEEQQRIKWQRHCLEVGIAKLPTSQRDALNLVIYSELPQKQAAEVMGVSLKALESLLVRAKRSLKKTINETQASAALNYRQAAS